VRQAREPEAGQHGRRHGLRGKLGLPGRPPPREEDGDEAEIRDSIHRERDLGAGPGDDRPAERRPGRAREVEGDAVQRHGSGQLAAGDLLANGGLPSGAVKGRARPEQEREGDQKPRRDEPEPGQAGEGDRDGQHRALRDQHDDPPVPDIGGSPCRQREQHDRQNGGDLDQGDHVGRGRERGHQPRRADTLDESAEVGQQARDPHREKDAGPERSKGGRRSRYSLRPIRAQPC